MKAEWYWAKRFKVYITLIQSKRSEPTLISSHVWKSGFAVLFVRNEDFTKPQSVLVGITANNNTYRQITICLKFYRRCWTMDDPSRNGLTLQARNARPNGMSALRVLKHGWPGNCQLGESNTQAVRDAAQIPAPSHVDLSVNKTAKTQQCERHKWKVVTSNREL